MLEAMPADASAVPPMFKRFEGKVAFMRRNQKRTEFGYRSSPLQFIG